MLDIDRPWIDHKERDMLAQCISEECIAQGKYVAQFEQEFSQYCGMKYACAVMNGTAALHLAFATLGIKPGDEVLVPTLTFIASASAVSYCGATPVFVDCDSKTWCMDTQDLRKKITPKTKAISPVHIYGNSCDMDKICSIAAVHDLPIVEDCAEALGTLYQGKHVGTFSDIACFSFFKGKHLTTGEGGMCLTNSISALERMRLLRSHAKDKVENLNDEDYALKQFVSSELGFNYRMTDLQAAVGLSQLRKLDQSIEKRVEYSRFYMSLLRDEDITLPYYDETTVRHAYWGFPVLLKDTETKVRVMIEFRKRGIRLRPFFYPCHLQPLYSASNSYGSCPVAEDVSWRGIVLPNIQTLQKDDVSMVAKWLQELLHD